MSEPNSPPPPPPLWSSQSAMQSMNDLLDKYPTAPSLESLQKEINDLRQKLEAPTKTRPRKATLASVDAKLDILISLLTNNVQ